MKWHWYALLAGIGLYGLILVPGFLPHGMDKIVAILGGMVLVSIGVFGFDAVHVGLRISIVMIVGSLILLGIGIVLAWQGHPYSLLVLSVPSIGLGSFGLRRIIGKREKND